MSTDTRITLTHRVRAAAESAGDELAHASGLSKSQIKQAMRIGGVWLRRAAPGALSALFRDGRIEKRYRVQVRGRTAEAGRIELPLDGKPACSDYRLLGYDQAADVATLEVVIQTGRLHQIRRHLEAVGHPVMGDPRYGAGNKNREGLRLVAAGLAFTCPLQRRRVEFALDEADIGF